MSNYRPTVAEVDLDALKFNYLQLRRVTGKGIKVLAVVKANAYGHGATQIAPELEKMGVEFFGVATIKEAKELRQAGIKRPIVILGGIYRGQAEEILKYDLTPVIFDLERARELSRTAGILGKKAQIHVNIDTGMGRLGILPGETESFFSRLKELKNLKTEGLLSHLAVSDRGDKKSQAFIRKQIDQLLLAIGKIARLGFNVSLRHIANSAFILDGNSFYFNLVRPGIMLYGAYPAARFKKKIELRPVMRLKSEIIQVKKLPARFSVSYGRTFFTQKKSFIATVPIGYADGYSRLFSNRGKVLVRGKKVSVVGTVCMDMIMIDVTRIPGVRAGDEVVLMGRQGRNEITVEELARETGTIPYEILCGISSRVERIYLKKQKVVERA